MFVKRFFPRSAAGGAYLALLVLLIVCSVSSPSFRQWQNLLNITRQVSYSGIIALGMTLVIIGGGIDLSVGSLLALTGCLSIITMNACPDPAWGLAAAFAVALLAGAAGGAVNGTLVTLDLPLAGTLYRRCGTAQHRQSVFPGSGPRHGGGHPAADHCAGGADGRFCSAA